MLDPTFLRPIAHRGLHDAGRGIVENTAAAFRAAMAGSFGIECDLRPAADGAPIVFHDATLDRLTDRTGPVSALPPAELQRVRYRAGGETVLSFQDMLDLVGGRVPLLVEVKSEWAPPDETFMQRIARALAGYRGPVALMSFDPAVVAALKALLPDVPRGIVSGSYNRGGDWWAKTLTAERRAALRDLQESGPAAPSFYAYEVDALPTPVTRQVREVAGLIIYAWTVRTAAQRARAAQWADAAIFEGEPPATAAERRRPGPR